MIETGGQNSRGGSPSETQRKIIEAAGDVFADWGYRHATVRAICDRAGVNIAAVNYHFGGKRNLYLATLKYWRAKAFEKYPFDPEALAACPPENRLEAFVRAILRRVLGEGDGSRFAKLMVWEFVRPTPGLDIMFEETFRPFVHFLYETVRQLFRNPPSETTLLLCCYSIVSQVVYLYVGRHAFLRILKKETLSPEDLEAITKHITRFSLYAIAQMDGRSKGEGE
jgi:TetR/AcrR family transcriptional regulator, regulator of cefoperazone and chloramphenicol sensitivity